MEYLNKHGFLAVLPLTCLKDRIGDHQSFCNFERRRWQCSTNREMDRISTDSPSDFARVALATRPKSA